MKNVAIWLAGCLLALTLLGGAVLAHSDPPLILAAEQYQLTTGQTVTVFLLERQGMWCATVSAPGGLDCEPLASTIYGRQIGKP